MTTALILWAVLSLPLGIAIGTFIKRGRGPEGGDE